MQRLFIMLLVVFALTGLTARPEADDYCVAGLVDANGIVHEDVMSYTADMYRGWSGRYSQLFLQGTLARFAPLDNALVPGALILAFVVCLSAILSAYNVEHTRWIAPAFTAAWLMALPGMDGVLFWQSGAMTYLLPVVIGLLALWLMKRERSSLWCLPLALIAGGCSETTTVMLAFIGLGLALLDRKLRMPALLWGIGLGVAFVVVYLAPGNAIRAAYFPAPSFSNAKWDTVTWLTGDYVVTIFRTLPGLILAYLAGRLYPVKVSSLTLAAAWSTCILVTFSTLFMVSYATGTSYHPDRVLAGVSLVTCGALYLTGGCGKRKRGEGMRSIAFLILTAGIVFNAAKLPERVVYAARYDTRAAQLYSGATTVHSLGEMDSLRPPFTPGNAWVKACAEAWIGHKFDVEG